VNGIVNGTEALPDTIARYRLCVLVTYYGLIGFFFISTPMMLGNLSVGTMAISLVQTLPLLLFASGLQRTKLRTYGWMSFVVLLYFVHAVLVAFRGGQLLQGLIEITLCTGLFCARILFIRSYREHYKTPL
jgi:uncharacterized membrane protein